MADNKDLENSPGNDPGAVGQYGVSAAGEISDGDLDKVVGGKIVFGPIVITKPIDTSTP